MKSASSTPAPAISSRRQRRSSRRLGGAIPEGESRVHRELLRNTVELVTGICESVPQAVDDLRESRDAVRRVARQRGLEIFSAGTYPFARWYDQEVSEGERYATLIERTQRSGRHMLIFGVHVHVGVDSVGKVLPILDGFSPRWFRSRRRCRRPRRSGAGPIPDTPGLCP